MRGYISNDVEVPLLLQYDKLKCSPDAKELSECNGYVIGEHSCSEPNGAVILCPGQSAICHTLAE